MSPRTITWLVLFAALLAGGFRLRFLSSSADTDELALQQATYENVRTLILDRYVKELGKDDQEKIFYGALKGMTASLDAHSQFLTPELYEYLSTSTRGQFAGIGLEIDMEALGLTVLTPLMDSPAWRAGIYPGDRIVAIDGVPTKDKSREECELRIKGPPDTPVRLTIERSGVDKPLELTLRRALIQIKSIQAEEILGSRFIPSGAPKIGYIQVALFQQNTAEDLGAALKRLEAQGMEALILDLRQNPGGLLDEAGQVGDLFLKDGEIVTVIDRDAAQKRHSAKVINVTPGRTHPDYPMAVLVDSQSASAAEIVSGALQDRGRAVLVGDKTYGKFSVQDVIPLPLGKKGGALKLTIAKYKTPKGECIDGQGIVPDFLVPSNLEQQKELLLNRHKRHLRDNDPRAKNGAAISPPDNAKEDKFNDTQLKKAVEVLKLKLAGVDPKTAK